MKSTVKISEAELEVMKILWDLGKATSSEIIDILIQSTDWKPKTIQTLITRLASKGAIVSEKTNGKAFIYTPNIKEEEYKSEANKSFLQKLYNGSLSRMVASFIKDEKLSKEEINKLKKLLHEEE